MSLADLVVVCRSCGGESIRALGRSATCEDCGTTYEYDPDEDRVTARNRDGERWTVDESESEGGKGGVLEASATARFATREVPVRHQGGLLGFVEQRGPHTPGTLRLRRDRVEFAEESGREHSWLLLDIRAVQTASASVQISPLSGGVVSFALEEQSPRRWEGFLREAVAAAWAAAGRGTVVEFQPRIRAE